MDDGDDALLIALAPHPQEGRVRLQVALVEAGDLGDAQAAAVEGLQQGPVAAAGGGLGAGHREEA